MSDIDDEDEWDIGLETRLLGLIHDPNERALKSDSNRRVVLDFLRSEPYTSTARLSQLLNCSLSGARKIAKRMVAEGLLIEDELQWMNSRKLQIFGISATGLYEYLSQDSFPPEFNRHYRKGKISPIYVEHTLLIQKVRIHLLSPTSWGESRGPWIDSRDLPGNGLKRGDLARWFVYPDAVLEDSGIGFKGSYESLTVAIEVERTRKSGTRYKDVISSHLANIGTGRYQAVIYYVDGDRAVESYRRLFSDITQKYGLNAEDRDVDGQPLGMKRFQFRSYAHQGSADDWEPISEMDH